MQNQLYLKPMREKKILESRALATLFSNIEMLYNLNKQVFFIFQKKKKKNLMIKTPWSCSFFPSSRNGFEHRYIAIWFILGISSSAWYLSFFLQCVVRWYVGSSFSYFGDIRQIISRCILFIALINKTL